MDRDHRMTEQAAIVPRLCFVINLAHAENAGPNLARLKHLVHLFRGHRLPATWAVADAAQTPLLRDFAATAVRHQIGLSLDESWAAAHHGAARFGDELSHRLARLSNASGSTTLLVGDRGQLGSRMRVLAELGIRAIFTSFSQAATPLKPRPLPCGMWLLAPRVRLPKPRLTRWLPTRATSVKELLASACAGNVLVEVAADEWERIGVRGMQALEKLLRDVSWSASRGQLQVVTVSEIVADLAGQYAVRPQRSILRLAA
jgi:hypothetical protein